MMQIWMVYMMRRRELILVARPYAAWRLPAGELLNVLGRNASEDDILFLPEPSLADAEVRGTRHVRVLVDTSDGKKL